MAESSVNRFHNLGFDPDELRTKYQTERDKRIRAEGNDQYRNMSDHFGLSECTNNAFLIIACSIMIPFQASFSIGSRTCIEISANHSASRSVCISAWAQDLERLKLWQTSRKDISVEIQQEIVHVLQKR